MNGKVSWAKAEVSFMYPLGVEQMLNGDDFEVKVRKGNLSRNPPFKFVSGLSMILCPYCCRNPTQTLLTPLARSSASRHMLQRTLFVN